MGGVKGLLIDVRDTEHLPDKVKEAEALFEENKIDILVNSAGVVVKHDFWGIDEKEYDGIMDTNAKGTFFMSQAVGTFQRHLRMGLVMFAVSALKSVCRWNPAHLSIMLAHGGSR